MHHYLYPLYISIRPMVLASVASCTALFLLRRTDSKLLRVIARVCSIGTSVATGMIFSLWAVRTIHAVDLHHQGWPFHHAAAIDQQTDANRTTVGVVVAVVAMVAIAFVWWLISRRPKAVELMSDEDIFGPNDLEMSNATYKTPLVVTAAPEPAAPTPADEPEPRPLNTRKTVQILHQPPNAFVPRKKRHAYNTRAIFYGAAVIAAAVLTTAAVQQLRMA